MSNPIDLRSRKRLAMRQAISDAATRLFQERGFDSVTIDEIAKAADVGRMTVFNHFPRKEDMFFDRDEEGRERLVQALLQRDPEISPIECLRLLAHQLVAEDSPFVRFAAGAKGFISAESQGFIETIEASPALKARARAIRDEIGNLLAEALSNSVQTALKPGEAELAAHLLLAGWTVALLQAHQCYSLSQDVTVAKTIFLNLIDKASAGVQAALAGTALV